MAGQRDTPRTRVLIVEDKLAHARAVLTRLAEHESWLQVVGVMDHAQALDEATSTRPDVAVIDAMRHPHDLKQNPGTIGFAGLKIAQALADEVPSCRVVGYSSDAHHPVVNITFREVPNVVAVYDQAVLVEHIAEVIRSTDHPRQVPAPTPKDFAALGLTPDARPWAALQLVMEREDTWAAITRTQGYLGVANKTRAHMNKHLPALLPMPEATSYRAYVELLRAVGGFG